VWRTYAAIDRSIACCVSVLVERRKDMLMSSGANVYPIFSSPNDSP
jgi:hypothetical protein